MKCLRLCIANLRENPSNFTVFNKCKLVHSAFDVCRFAVNTMSLDTVLLTGP